MRYATASAMIPAMPVTSAAARSPAPGAAFSAQLLTELRGKGRGGRGAQQEQRQIGQQLIDGPGIAEGRPAEHRFEKRPAFPDVLKGEQHPAHRHAQQRVEMSDQGRSLSRRGFQALRQGT